jgi:hypothetical protein
MTNELPIDLEGCLIQVEASKAWFARRVLPLSLEQLRWRPRPRQWSIAECLDHLNLTVSLYLPQIDRPGEARCPRSSAAGTGSVNGDAVSAAGGPARADLFRAPEAAWPSAAADPTGWSTIFICCATTTRLPARLRARSGTYRDCRADPSRDSDIGWDPGISGCARPPAYTSGGVRSARGAVPQAVVRGQHQGSDGGKFMWVVNLLFGLVIFTLFMSMVSSPPSGFRK